jgi:hypothetical protein
VGAPTLFCIEFLFGCKHRLLFAKRKVWSQKKRTVAALTLFCIDFFIWVQAPPALCEKKRVEPKETDCAAPSLVCVDFYIKNASQNEKHFLCKIDSKAPIEKVFESC